MGGIPSYLQICKGQVKTNIIHLIKGVFVALRMDGIYAWLMKKCKKQDEHPSQVGTIGYVTGADLFLRNDENAFFNEDYFMYYEETELELNLAKKGLTRHIIDGTRIIHDQSTVPDGTIKMYSASDYFTENSSIIYSRNNCCRNAILLRLLVKINGLNPYVRKVRKGIAYDI